MKNILLFIFIISISYLYADNIYLNNGSIIKNVIILNTDSTGFVHF